MKTGDDAKRVVALYDERSHLQAAAETFGKAPDIGVFTRRSHNDTMDVVFSHLMPDLKALIAREIELQVATIDAELTSLGFDPDQPSSDDD